MVSDLVLRLNSAKVSGMTNNKNPFIPESVDGVAYYELVEGDWTDPNLEIDSWGYGDNGWDD